MSFCKRLLQFATTGAISLTMLLLLGRFHWFLETLTHFRLPLAVGLSVLLTLLIATKCLKLAIPIASCLLLQVLPLSHHYLPLLKDHREGEGPQLKVITFNVLTSNVQQRKVLHFLEKEDADVICLQETDKEWLASLKALWKDYPYSIEYPRSDNFGLLLLSKHPITNHQIENNTEFGTPYLKAQLDWLGTPLTTIIAHPLPPMSKSAATSRNATLEQVRLDARQKEQLLIVVGDFNCSAYSPFFQPLKKTLRDSSRGRGYAATWRRGHPLLGIPIDHLLHSENLVCTSRKIGPTCGSDHSPIIATLQARADSE